MNFMAQNVQIEASGTKVTQKVNFKGLKYFLFYS